MSVRFASYAELLCVVAILAITAVAVLPRLAGGGYIALGLVVHQRWLRQKSMDVPCGHTQFPQIRTNVSQLHMDYGAVAAITSVRAADSSNRVFLLTASRGWDVRRDAFQCGRLGELVRLCKDGKNRSVIIDRVGRIQIE